MVLNFILILLTLFFCFFITVLRETLEEKGILDRLRAELRSEIFSTLESEVIFSYFQ